MAEPACICDPLLGKVCAHHAELAARVRTEGFDPVARSTGWVPAGDLADARHELDVLRGINVDLDRRYVLALQDVTKALAERDWLLAEAPDDLRDRYHRLKQPDEPHSGEDHVAVPREQWRQMCDLRDKAKAAAKSLVWFYGSRGWADFLATVDALDEDDPRGEVTGDG